VADPIFWLALSLLLVAISLTAVLMAAVPALRELGRASRSAEKLFDTLNRELPPTLEAIRLTGREITELTDEVSEGVSHAGKVIQQVDQSVHAARSQAQQLHVGSRSLMAGLQAAWLAWQKPAKPARKGARKATKYSPEGRNLRSRPPTSSPPTAARSHDSSGRSLQAPPDSQLPSSKSHSADQLPSVPPPTAQKAPVKPLPGPQQEASGVGQAAESSHEVADVD
jgi:uncharacterized protein YoxC